jgi:hypothetical protein
MEGASAANHTTLERPKHTMKRFQVLTVLAAALALTACGGPGSSDIKKIIEAQLAAQADQMRAFASNTSVGRDLTGQFASIKVTDVKVIGCKEDGGAYNCDFEAEISVGGKVEKVPPQHARLVKGSDGWVESR